MINAALIGLGWWGKNLAKAIQGNSELIQFGMAVTKEVDEAQGFAQQHGLPLSNQFEDALNNPAIQAVVLATPHSLHADQIVAAAQAGKHVFCEKPLTLTSADAKRAIQACESRELTLAVGQNKRFWPSMVKLREVAASGVLGQVLHLEGHYSNEHSTKFFSDWRDSPAESPAGGLTGTGIHIIDAFVGLAGPAVEVSAQVFNVRSGKDPRDATSVMVRFANGVNGFLPWCGPRPFSGAFTSLATRHRLKRLGRTSSSSATVAGGSSASFTPASIQCAASWRLSPGPFLNRARRYSPTPSAWPRWATRLPCLRPS